MLCRAAPRLAVPTHMMSDAVTRTLRVQGTSSAETLRRGLHDPQPPLRDAVRTWSPSPVGRRLMLSLCRLSAPHMQDTGVFVQPVSVG